MSHVERRLAELGIELPQAQFPIASYIPVKRSGNLLFLSGVGPAVNGVPQMQGLVGKDVTVEEAYQGARLAAIYHLAALKAELGDLDRVRQVVKVLGFVASAPDFYEQPKVLNGYSDLMSAAFGEGGRHARSAIAVPVLPMNLPVEVETIVEIRD